jgi:hypothetical protein
MQVFIAARLSLSAVAPRLFYGVAQKCTLPKMPAPCDYARRGVVAVVQVLLKA